MNEKNTQNVIPNVNSKKKEERNVPDLRFSEFSWNEIIFKDIASFFKGNGLSKELLSDSGNDCILYGELYTKYIPGPINKVISKTTTIPLNPVYSKKNDIILPSSGESNLDISTACCIQEDNILLGGDLNVIRVSQHDGSFICYQLIGKRKQDIAKIAQGASIVHLHNSDLEKLKLFVPTAYNDELKISSFLNIINERIVTQKKIIECYKSFMKSISNIILSAETNVKLGDICEIKKGTQLNSKDFDKNGIYPVINGGVNISGYSNNFNSENMITISEGGNSSGYVNYFKEKFWSGGHNYTLTKKSNFNYDYLFHYLKYKEKDIMSLRVGSGLPNIQKTSIINFSIYIPNIDSQTKITNILNSILNKIQNEKSILSLYIKEKEYLLNKLFI